MKDDLAKINLDEYQLDAAIRRLFERFLNHIEVLTKENRELKEEKQQLRDEIARLKGEKGQPKIKANKKEEKKSGADEEKKKQIKPTEEKEAPAPRSERIKIDREDVRKLDRQELPPDVRHCGYRDVVIQNIKFETDNVLYKLERMYSPGTKNFYEAELPAGLKLQRYGHELRAWVLNQYFVLRTPEEKILEMLCSEGIVISAGEISRIITEKHLALFSEEREGLVNAGLESTSYQNIDDTGGRQNGVNQYVTVICNPHFSSFYTNQRKDAETVAHLLSPPKKPAVPGESESPAKRLTEYIDILVADDAGQFHNQTRIRALCWIHEERHYQKLMPYFDKHADLVEEFRTAYWDYYGELKAYQAEPTESKKAILSQAFDELFSPTTGYADLDHRIELTKGKKAELLVVLDYPEVPLHNNGAEQAVREFVVKRKISNGTRTEKGTKAWDIYLSVSGTCRKLGVNFYRYVLDRISNSYQMPSLAELIRQKSQLPSAKTAI